MADVPAPSPARSSSRAARVLAVRTAPATVVLLSIAAAQLVGRVGSSAIVPWPVVAKGAISGLVDALAVVALVLIYRAARIVNFAVVGVGVLAVMSYLLLRQVWGWSFWIVFPVVLVGAALVGGAVEIGIVRRFRSAPRLVLTVVTIAVGLTLSGVALLAPALFDIDADAPLPPFGPATPFSGTSVSWFPEVFTGEHVMATAVAAIVLGALAMLLRRSAVGVAVRGAAENRDRAATLGINTSTLSLVVWSTATFLAALAAVLGAMTTRTSLAFAIGAAGSAAVGAPTLLRLLAAAVVARMERIPLAVAAAIGISVLDSAVFWSFRKTAIVDGALLVVVFVALATQRRGTARSDDAVTQTWEAAEELRPIPASLAALPIVRRGTRRLAVGLLLGVLAFPWLMSPSQTLAGSHIAIVGLVTVSLVVLTGWGGQVSLGQFGFAAVGALTGGSLAASTPLPFPLALAGAAIAGAAAAVAVGLPALRVRGLFLAVTTLGFAVAAQSILLNNELVGFIPSRVNRPSFLGIDMNADERAFYYLCVVVLAVSVMAATSLRRTRTGRVLIAMRDNERTAQSFGINLVRVRLATFAISGAMAAVAGFLFAAHQYTVRASSFGADVSIRIFLVAIIGGLGSVSGVLLGATYFGIASILIGGVAGQLLASSLGVLLVLIFFPGGLGALAYRGRDAWLRRIALRYRIFVPSLLAVDRRSASGELVPLTERVDERIQVPRRYRVRSVIATTGASQTTRTWQG